MSLILLCIVGDVSEQNSMMNSVQADDWTAERAIIASNGLNCIGFSVHSFVAFWLD